MPRQTKKEKRQVELQEAVQKIDWARQVLEDVLGDWQARFARMAQKRQESAEGETLESRINELETITGNLEEAVSFVDNMEDV